MKREHFIIAALLFVLLAGAAFAGRGDNKIIFQRGGIGNATGIDWITNPNNPKIVGGVTFFKDASASPNRLWLASNFGVDKPPVDASGEVVLIAKDGNGNPILLRVFASPTEGRYVSVEGGVLRVEGLQIGDVKLEWNEKMEQLEMIGADGTARFALDTTPTSAQSIANNGTWQPFGAANNFSGIVIINDTWFGNVALVLVGNVITIGAQSSTNYSTTSGTASKINVYKDGSGFFTIENKAGSTITLTATAVRTRTTS